MREIEWMKMGLGLVLGKVDAQLEHAEGGTKVCEGHLTAAGDSEPGAEDAEQSCLNPESCHLFLNSV